MFPFSESPDDVIEVLNIVPLQGPAGIVAPSCEAAIALAVEEINSGTGILGREVRVTTIDGGRAPREVAKEVSALLATGMVDAITGWHISAVRRAVARAADGRVPYLFATTHEDLPNEPPGVLMIGENPAGHILPAMQWLEREFGARRWAIIGNDYIWPMATGKAVRTAHQGSITLEKYFPLGTEDFSEFLGDPRLDRADGIVLLLVGTDAVRFNQQFAHTGRSERQVRVSPGIDEGVLLAAGPQSNDNLYVVSSFFPDNRTSDPDRMARYHRLHGRFAPQLTYFGNTSYEAMYTLQSLAHGCGSLDVPLMQAALDDGMVLETPSGGRAFQGNHSQQFTALIARADGVDLQIVDTVR
ncbi:substrate-binding domain-containing protein [Nocardia pseudobrasiliensis]|uniref:Amino acid/amide ABC transporter substrate-binding protein (HAAT family) n=1 Tax=Nocardia pseudobrasiliensis TaxID=45979 RepID=A0A370I6H6_9NOCA|nr:substrate-binding domain-containing protein [Nocardia pseudobrasiliensis]RDI66240.1 amino acid/amide ABC transporter substrate-binding protein (HAAT family) [Nocardia pseudobrasiliensis]